MNLLCAVSPEALRLSFFPKSLSIRRHLPRLGSFRVGCLDLCFFDYLRLVIRRRKVELLEALQKSGESHTCGSNHLRL